MLVEYGFETKDEEMLPRAIELRKRMASRRLTNALKGGTIDEKGLKKIIAANEAEKDEHTHENFTITMAEVKEKVAVGRAEQQLNLEAGVRRLHRDLDRASKLSKSRIDILGDLEARIIKMKQQLIDPTPKTVEQEIGNQLVQSVTQKNDKQFEVCTLCQRRILVALYDKHVKQCEEKEGKYDNKRVHETKPPVYDLNQDKITRLATFVPKPPRNCKVVETGATFIRWEWEEPVTDGGLPVHEYEIKYTEKFMEMNKKTKRYITTITEKESHLTSIWCAREPICHTGCKIVFLKGNTEYNSFKIRSKNLRGWSEWADMLDHVEYSDEDEDDGVATYRPKYPHVRTEPVEAPSPPMRFRMVEITSSCLHLAWDMPFYDGGSPIVDFIVYLTVQEVCTTTTERDVVIPYDMKQSTEGIATSCVVRNLPSDTIITKIRIKVMNKIGLLSEEAKLPPLNEEDPDPKTKLASRYILVHREFDRCTASKETFIDTSFFTGVQQRLLRVDFIKALEAEMKLVKPDELERQEAKAWLAEKERRAKRDADKAAEEAANDPFGDDPDDDDESEALDKRDKEVFSNQQRRVHFKAKLESLRQQIIDYTAEKYDLDTNRSKLTKLMKVEQQKRMALRLERDRVKSFKGNIVTSSVLQGAPMQYVFGDFMKKVDAAILEADSVISESKFAVMAGEERKHKVKKFLEKATKETKTRQALFLQFDLKHKQTLRALHKMNNADADERVMRKYFELIRAYGEERKGVRALFSKVMVRRVYLAKKNSFNKWKHGDQYEEELSLNGDDGLISRGGLMLDETRKERLELQQELRNAMAMQTTLKHKTEIAGMATDNRKQLTRSKDFRSMEEGMDHLRYGLNGMHFLYEADGHAKEGNFLMAYSTYEAQILYLRSEPTLNIKLLAITHGRLGRMFLLQSKFDRAIVEFDRQLSLAREVDDKPEQADAYFGVGRGYLEIRDYDNAIRYLGIAQTRLSSLGNMKKYCDCMRALKEIYERLGEKEPVKMYDEKISRIEGELNFKLGLIGTKLNDLTLRLNNTNAEIEHMVKLERTSLTGIRLKVEIHDLHGELEESEEAEDKAEDDVDELKSLLNEIQAETDMAYATDELEMISNLVHDQPQMMEVEELKNRLSARKKVEVKKLEKAELKLKGLKVKVHNLEDSIHEKNALLDLENGPLMSNSTHHQAFRCVAFCEANAQGDEVTGTNTGGAENFVAGEGSNIHVLDYHSGELLHVFAGEPKGSHREGMSAESFGHGGVVTCLVHDCENIYSGSTDETVRRWNVKDHEQELIYRGHEGSITAIAVDAMYMCSGSSDATIRLWNKHDGRQLRTVYGHHKSILALDLGPTWMLSGSTDEEVRVWTIKEKSIHTTLVDCKNRLIGHDVAVTCVKYSKLEIVSADVLGRVFIWWMKTGEVIRKIEAHTGAIKSLQFDAVNIVAGGVDNCVSIIDIATGDVQQKLRGHEGSVLAVAFDSERIISAGGDNTLRYWQWGKKVLPQDKFHVLDAGQTLMAVSKLYPETSMQELMTWNGIKEARQVFPGMKLIVKKGDPSELTEAEKAEEERERRRQATTAIMSKRTQDSGMLKSSIAKYDRVHRIATDEDQGRKSLGNRMFHGAKREQELFPDKIDLNANPHALSHRLLRDFEAERRSALVPRPVGVYFMNKENEEEWGAVADTVCAAMISMFIEYESYEMVMEAKRTLRSTTSLIGRIHAFEAHVETMGSREAALKAKYHTKTKRFLMPEERKAKRKAEKKEARRVAKEEEANKQKALFAKNQADAKAAKDAMIEEGLLIEESGSTKSGVGELPRISTADKDDEKDPRKRLSSAAALPKLA